MTPPVAGTIVLIIAALIGLVVRIMSVSIMAGTVAAAVLAVVIGCGIAWGLAIVGTLVILKICDKTVGLRVTREQERQGLDVSLHGEEGYIFEG